MAAMIQRMARTARSRVATIAIGLLLAVGGLAALPAVPANAASQVVSWWNEGGAAEEAWFFCDNPQISTFPSGDYALEVYNPCGVRVWLHYYSGGKVYAYCVNPKGGLAYHFPYKFTDIQVTTNTSLCDPNAKFEIVWGQDNSAGSLVLDAEHYVCQPGYPQPWVRTGWWVASVSTYDQPLLGYNGCDFRIWLHQHDDGSGASLCLNRNQLTTYSIFSPIYWQVQETRNQAPCNAGGPPYPY